MAKLDNFWSMHCLLWCIVCPGAVSALVQLVGPLHQRAQQLQGDIKAIMTARYSSVHQVTRNMSMSRLLESLTYTAIAYLGGLQLPFAVLVCH